MKEASRPGDVRGDGRLGSAGNSFDARPEDTHRVAAGGLGSIDRAVGRVGELTFLGEDPRAVRARDADRDRDAKLLSFIVDSFRGNLGADGLRALGGGRGVSFRENDGKFLAPVTG